MRLLGVADQWPKVIADSAADIAWIETKLGTVIVRADMIQDLKEKGVKTLGWAIQPTDASLVCVFPTFNWAPGSGPRTTLKDAVQSIKSNLEQCIRVEVGAPGLRDSGVPA